MFHIHNLDINPKLIECASKAGLKLSSSIIKLTHSELKTKCNISDNEAVVLMEAAAESLCPAIQTVANIYAGDRANVGNFKILNMLQNYEQLPNGIIEIAGESGTGKTQFGLNLSLNSQGGNMERKTVYLCTEGRFPSARLKQILISCEVQQPEKFSNNILIQQIPNIEKLIECIQSQLPSLIEKENIKLIIIDSVAAVFRGSEETQKEKSVAIEKIGYLLHQISHKFLIKVVALNQVTSVSDGSVFGSKRLVMPALGLLWANFTSVKIYLEKTNFCIVNENNIKNRVRTIELISSPHLPYSMCHFIINNAGVKEVHFNEENIGIFY